MKLRIIYFLFIVFFCSLLPIASSAQFNDPFPANPSNDPAPASTSTPSSPSVVDPPPDPVDTPIDGGLSILIGAGVALGYKKFRANRKPQKVVVVDEVK